MIEQLEFLNFKALRRTSLKLGRFTLLVGPNGSGKSTVFQALRAFQNPSGPRFEDVVSVGVRDSAQLTLGWSEPSGAVTELLWEARKTGAVKHKFDRHSGDLTEKLDRQIQGFKVYSFEPKFIAAPVELHPDLVLTEAGGNLVGVLDLLRDSDPERFAALNEELGRWLPEFDQILFTTLEKGKRALKLRTRAGRHPIRASDLSSGTLLSLGLMTLAYGAKVPGVVGVEEPDRGVHPRLLRHVRDTLYRLSHPEMFNDTRPATQVVVTTHSPLLLDLYRDHIDEVVVAEKAEGYAHFTRLSERSDVKEILGTQPLGDLWYTGVLGGVPSET